MEGLSLDQRKGPSLDHGGSIIRDHGRVYHWIMEGPYHWPVMEGSVIGINGGSIMWDHKVMKVTGHRGWTYERHLCQNLSVNEIRGDEVITMSSGAGLVYMNWESIIGSRCNQEGSIIDGSWRVCQLDMEAQVAQWRAISDAEVLSWIMEGPSLDHGRVHPLGSSEGLSLDLWRVYHWIMEGLFIWIMEGLSLDQWRTHPLDHEGPIIGITRVYHWIMEGLSLDATEVYHWIMEGLSLDHGGSIIGSWRVCHWIMEDPSLDHEGSIIGSRRVYHWIMEGLSIGSRRV
uniref:Uncharacterized protein n=1 Tax=Parascaris univalens TaxID=6257 RepID=A0A915B3D3_PARUN